MNHPAWIIIAGSSVPGLEFIGPFRDYNAAEAYFKSQGSPTPWLVTALDPPESEEPSAERDDLREQYDNLKEHHAVLRRANDDLDNTRWSLLESEKKRWAEIHALRTENHTLAAERSKTLSDSEGMISARDGRVNELNQECDRLDTENNELSARVWALQEENDRLVRIQRDDTEIRDLRAERDGLRNLYENVVEHRDSLFDALGDQTDKNYQLRTERDNAVSDYKRLERQHRDLNATDSALGDRYNTLRAEYEDLKARCTQPYFAGLIDERDELTRKLRAIGEVLG